MMFIAECFLNRERESKMKKFFRLALLSVSVACITAPAAHAACVDWYCDSADCNRSTPLLGCNNNLCDDPNYFCEECSCKPDAANTVCFCT